MDTKAELNKLKGLSNQINKIGNRKKVATTLNQLKPYDIDVAISISLYGMDKQHHKISNKKGDLKKVINYSIKLLSDDLATESSVAKHL